MRNTILAVSALALMAASTPAFAADPYGRDSLKDDVAPEPARRANWTGFYIGGQVGYGNSNHNLTVQEYATDAKCSSSTGCDSGASGTIVPHDPEDEGSADFAQGEVVAAAAGSVDWLNLDGVNASGLIGGARIGYDYARGRVLFGVFAGYDLSSMESTLTAAPFGVAASLEKQDEWLVGARVGYLVTPATLIYALAAYNQTQYDVKGLSLIEPQENESLKKSATFGGISVGGGVEVAITNNVFLGVEYTHTFYGAEDLIDHSFSYDPTGEVLSGKAGTRIKDELDEDKIMATLKIKLNSGLGEW